MAGKLEIIRWMQVGAAVHAVALSAEGRYVLVGSERDLCLLDRRGGVRFRYHSPGQKQMYFHLVAMTAKMDMVLAATRPGSVIQIEVEVGEKQFDAWPMEIFFAEGDLYDLALAADGQLAALGHLGPALTVLNLQGLLDAAHQPAASGNEGIGLEDLLVWRRHPDDGNPTDGQIWAVALDPTGEVLYVGSSGASHSMLAALDARTAQPLGFLHPERRVTQVAALSQPPGVAAVLTDGGYAHTLTCYTPQLDVLRWEQDFEEHITALAADPVEDLVAVGSGFAGQVTLFKASFGEMVAQHPELDSLNTCLAIVDGRYLAAGTQRGDVAYLEYRAEEFRL